MTPQKTPGQRIEHYVRVAVCIAFALIVLIGVSSAVNGQQQDSAAKACQLNPDAC